MEMLIAISLILTLSAAGLYGWRHWQQQQQLWQTARQVRDYLVVTPGLGFDGLRDTAWAGRIRLQSQAGEWLILVSSWGRIRMCNGKGEFACR